MKNKKMMENREKKESNEGKEAITHSFVVMFLMTKCSRH